MSLWNRQGPKESAGNPRDSTPVDGASNAPPESPSVSGERGVPPHDPFRTVQSRVSSLLTVSLMVILAGGLLVWYYSGAVGRSTNARLSALAAQQRKAQGDSTLPPLGSFHLNNAGTGGGYARRNTSGSLGGNTEGSGSGFALPPGPDGSNGAAQPTPVEQILGEAPQAPIDAPEMPLSTVNPYDPAQSGGPARPKTPAQLLLDRRLAGPVLTHTAAESSAQTAPAGTDSGGSDAANTMGMLNTMAPGSGGSAAQGREEGANHGPTLESLLHATPTPAVTARVLPTQRYLLPQGAFIDCTLETAISSSLPGMTTCITATDTFGADGNIVLLERGTKLVGETRGTVQAGSPRLFVLWTEARTPTGIVVPLASPGTDELGRSGLSGDIDWHWWQRFSSAILVTLLDGVVQGFADRSNSNSIQINPSGATEVVGEVLRGSMNIPPTINKPQGDRIQILVARDVDFRTVYTLRTRLSGVR